MQKCVEHGHLHSNFSIAGLNSSNAAFVKLSPWARPAPRVILPTYRQREQECRCPNSSSLLHFSARWGWLYTYGIYSLSFHDCVEVSLTWCTYNLFASKNVWTRVLGTDPMKNAQIGTGLRNLFKRALHGISKEPPKRSVLAQNETNATRPAISYQATIYSDSTAK